ncbi:hypothetical protein D3C85_1475220 [compost metagenome]
MFIAGKEYEKKDGSGNPTGEKGYFYSVNLAKVTLQEVKASASAPTQATQQPINVGAVKAEDDDLPF